MEQIFTEALAKIPQGELDVFGLLHAADTLKLNGRVELAIGLYQAWISHNNENPLLFAVYYNYGAILRSIDRNGEAAWAYSQAINLNPCFAPSYINLSFIYEMLGHLDQAVECLQRLVNVLSLVTEDNINSKATALRQIARIFDRVHRDSTVEDTLKQSISLDNQNRESIQHFVNTRMYLCKWPAVVRIGQTSESDIIKTMAPLSMLCYTDDPFLQLATAYAYGKHDVRRPGPIGIAGSWLPPAAPRPAKLRIGYASSDLHRHAVASLVPEVFELHDRNKVEVFAYYWGPAIPDHIHSRIRAATDTWRNIHHLGNEQAAAQIIEDKIDILVDLNGHSSSARTTLFSYRPAPIIVNWLGFPGTMASFHHTYIIADEYIIPKDYERYYSERVLRLPCYQPNDRRRVISGSPQTREGANLPEDAFVYCCFNGLQKINRFTFERWLGILQQVPNSVLWLLDGGEEGNRNLAAFAAEHGISPERIVFAPKIANHEHLARYPLADLFLDSSPYGAHTTASDALWMGVPILTVPGRSFASRVCASLVHAAGMDELICQTPEAYVARAVELGLNSGLVNAYKEKIARNRDSCVLFNSPLLVSSLEDLYRKMWQDYANGDIPQPSLKNIPAYHEIGSGLDHEGIEMLSHPDYDGLYQTMIEYQRNYMSLSDD